MDGQTARRMVVCNFRAVTSSAVTWWQLHMLVRWVPATCCRLNANLVVRRIDQLTIDMSCKTTARVGVVTI